MSIHAGDAHILWMERDGEIYSPEMPLGRATLELIERDLWNGVYAGICRAVFSYGAHSNGGGHCRDVTQEVAERLGALSFSTRDGIRPTVRAFLDAMGVTYDEGRPTLEERAEDAPFEMVAPPEPVSRARRVGTKRRAKALTPQQLRAQPQLKLPIAGGKAAERQARRDGLLVESELDETSGVEAVSLKDTRSLAEQRASWDRVRAMIRSWKDSIDTSAITRRSAEETARDRRSARGRR